MPNGGLVDRLDRSGLARGRPVAAGAHGSSATSAHRLDDVARSLRDVVDKTSRAIVAERMATVTAAVAAPAGDAEAQLPQILQHPPQRLAQLRSPSAGGPGLLAPGILVVALLAVAGLMSTSLDSLLGPADRRSADVTAPRLTAMTLVAPALDKGLDWGGGTGAAAAGSGPTVLESAPPLGLEEIALLERCEGMIARGEIQEARQELARAAQAGSHHARFALAETFDPNVLAAWGLREHIADVGTARALYQQALEAGDTRARGRIEALNSAR